MRFVGEVMTRESRLQVRMEEELFEKIEKFAAEAGVSSNQLARGVLRWFVEKGQARMEPFRNADGMVQERNQPGCVWVGTTGHYLTTEDREWMANQEGCGLDDIPDLKGEVLFCLDFTCGRMTRNNQRVLRR